VNNLSTPWGNNFSRFHVFENQAVALVNGQQEGFGTVNNCLKPFLQSEPSAALGRGEAEDFLKSATRPRCEHCGVFDKLFTSGNAFGREVSIWGLSAFERFWFDG